jgi:hypothetical protein
LRGQKILEAFREFKREYLRAHQEAQSDHEGPPALMPKFKAPQPKLHESILDLFTLFQADFQDPEFKAGIARSFVKTGACPKGRNTDGQWEFNSYVESAVGGTTLAIPTGTPESVWASPQVAAQPEVAVGGAAVGGVACDVGGALFAELISALEVVFSETVDGADNNDFETDSVSYEF